MYANPTYDDEYAYDNRAGFGSPFTDLLKKVAQAKTAPPAPVAPVSSPGYVPVPLPPPIVAPAQPGASQPILVYNDGASLPKTGPVSAQTTVGAPLSPTVGQQSGATPIVITGTGDGGLLSAPAPAAGGGIGAAVSQFVSSPTGLAVLAVVGFLALSRSRGNRRY